MKLSEKDIIRRTALCKALFLAPREIFERVDRFIDISIDTYIENQTGQRPGKQFPLDFWSQQEQDTLPEDPTKIMANLEDKDPKGRAYVCRVLFLATPGMFRDIETYFSVCLHSFIKKKTGKKPNSKYPMDFWVNKGPGLKL